MSSVAEQLRSGREAKNLTVHQVAEITKIRTDHIRALEEGNFSVFSAPVYIRGFVRSYAQVLKLDTMQVMSALETELGRSDKFREPPALTESSRGVLNFITLQLSKLNRRTARAIIICGTSLVVLVIVILVLHHHQAADPLANVPPGTYQSPQGGELLPLPSSGSHHP